MNPENSIFAFTVDFMGKIYRLPYQGLTAGDEFFKEMIYLSDSAGSDIKKKLLEVNLSSLNKTIQMLTHPIWWASTSKSPSETLYKWLEEHQSFIISETKRNCKSFKM